MPRSRAGVAGRIACEPGDFPERSFPDRWVQVTARISMKKVSTPQNSRYSRRKWRYPGQPGIHYLFSALRCRPGAEPVSGCQNRQPFPGRWYSISVRNQSWLTEYQLCHRQRNDVPFNLRGHPNCISDISITFKQMVPAD